MEAMTELDKAVKSHGYHLYKGAKYGTPVAAAMKLNDLKALMAQAVEAGVHAEVIALMHDGHDKISQALKTAGISVDAEN